MSATAQLDLWRPPAGPGRRYAMGWQVLSAFGAKSVGIFVGICFVIAHPFGLVVDSARISTSGAPFGVSRMASRTPMALRRAVSMTERMSA